MGGRTSTVEKVLIVGALLYLVSPFDAVPDLVPVVGWLDDLGVAGLVLNYLLKKADEKGAGPEGAVVEVETVEVKQARKSGLDGR